MHFNVYELNSTDILKYFHISAFKCTKYISEISMKNIFPGTLR